MKRRVFIRRAVAAGIGAMVAGRGGARGGGRGFPGRLRRLNETDWKERGRWAG